MTVTESNNAIAAENLAGEQVKPLSPPGFVYRPPVESICPCCGAKHTGYTRSCSPCRDALARGE